MRVANSDQLSKLGEAARKQLAPHLKAVKAAAKQPSSLPLKGKPKKEKLARIVADPATGAKFCPVPSPDPAVWLHQGLEREFGSYWEGGLLATEVMLADKTSRSRFDYFLVPYGVFIEMDGFQYHRTLDAFKNDRAKSRKALLQNYIVHRVTNSDIRAGIDLIIEDLKTIVSHREKQNIVLEKVGNVYCRIV